MDVSRSLVEQHVLLFNQGVTSDDFGPMLALFTDDAELIFDGITVGPFRGKAAIAEAYQHQPPTDEIDVLAIHESGQDTHVDYSWRGIPHQHAGTMIITADGNKISRLLIVYKLDRRGPTMEKGRNVPL